MTSSEERRKKRRRGMKITAIRDDSAPMPSLDTIRKQRRVVEAAETIIQEMTDPDGQRVSAEKRIGANLRTLRERAGMSQAAVAAAMTERGHSWHQSTVARVETAAQSLRLREAVDLAAILQVPLSALSE